MTDDLELTAWRETWQWSAQNPEPSPVCDIRREVQRKELRLRMKHLFEIAWALFLLAFSFILARRHPSTEMLVWALTIWILTLFASGYSIWNWRMLWIAEKKPAFEYTQVYEKYCIAGLREIRFGYCFLAACLAINVPWISWRFFLSSPGDHSHLIVYLLSMGIVAGLTLGYLLWFQIARKNRLRELEQLRLYRKSLEEER